MNFHLARAARLNISRRRPKGQALIEFALTMPLLLLMAFGTFSASLLLERYLTVLQLVRNAGNMYSRSVDFSLPQNRQLLLRSANGLSMTLDGGDGVIYLSTVEVAEAGLNSGFPVVTNRIEIGNVALEGSRIANPAAILPNGDVDDFENDPLARAAVAPSLTLASGDIAYFVEAYHTPADIPVVDSFFGPQHLAATAYY
jgi:hypothetical protein